MDASLSIPELVAAAQADMKAAHGDTPAMTAIAVDIFGVFEARMQHHFKRGPFSRKLTALLLEGGHKDLANRVHHYYLAINVLKHGKGASYRELLATRKAPFAIHPDTDALVDVTAPDFFDGLTATILEAHDFLESK